MKTKEEIEKELEELVRKWREEKAKLNTPEYFATLNKIRALKWVLGIDEIEKRFGGL